MSVWLGLDPSIAAFGWALLDTESGLVALGSWRTKVDAKAGKFEDRARRAEAIGRQLIALISNFRPSSASIEAPVLMPNDGKMSVHASARVRGVAEGVCLALGLPLTEVSPQDVKRAIAGEPGASKEAVARRLFHLYGRDTRIGDADDNATDALAVAHVGLARGGMDGRGPAPNVVSNRPGVGPFDPFDLDF